MIVKERKHYIDWVRVMAFSLLIFFHCAMPFVIFGWEIKNKEQSIGLSRLIWWLHQWRLPLLFFISGAGIYFSLASRSVISFVGERVVRLFIPLVFAMLFTIPFQVYFERLQKGEFKGSYLSFYPSVWNFIPYPEGSLTWSHMWFVVYLFVYCILLVPVFALFKIKALKNMKETISNKLSNPFALSLLFIPLAIYYYTLFLKWPEQQNLLEDWFLFVFSLTLLVFGYFLGGNQQFWSTCERYKYLFLSLAGICICLLFIRYWWNFKIPEKQDFDLYLYGTLNAMHIWFLILGILGMAKKHLNFTNGNLKYANQAVYPFYILHQTIIVITGYYIVQWQIPILLKLVILILVCFGLLFLIFYFLIRPFKLTRILYGVKLRDKK